jgi:hypothetical protein
MAKKEDVSLFERLIVMMFGVGVVMAGLYPLTRQYGGIREFVKSKSASAVNVLNKIEAEVNRAQLADPQKANKVDSIDRKVSVSKGDKLDNKDRKELDGLIDNIWK